MKPLWIFGGGGHAKSVIDAARTSGMWDVLGVLDDGAHQPDAIVSGVPVRGPIVHESLKKHRIRNAVIAIGDNATRQAVVERFGDEVEWATVVHSATYVAPDVRLGSGTVILAGSVIQPACVVGDHVIANTSCTIGHDCDVGDFAHVAPGANLAGGAIIGRGAFLGIGSRVIPLRRVGEWSTIGAGGVVIEDIPDGVTAVGVPARPLEPTKFRSKTGEQDGR